MHLCINCNNQEHWEKINHKLKQIELDYNKTSPASTGLIGAWVHQRCFQHIHKYQC